MSNHNYNLRKRPVVMNTAVSNAALGASHHRAMTVNINVSVRLFCLRSSLPHGLPPRLTSFVDMSIITNPFDYADNSPGRAYQIMGSLLVQIGMFFGVKIPDGVKYSYHSLNGIWQWRLQREANEIRTLKDIVSGDRLVLRCGEHWVYGPLDGSTLKNLPFKNCVKVKALKSPLRVRDVNDGTTSSNKPPSVAAKVVSITNDSSRSYVRPAVSGKENSNEVIVISSDDESDCSSDVEDVTDEWRAKRGEELRIMMANAEEID